MEAALRFSRQTLQRNKDLTDLTQTIRWPWPQTGGAIVCNIGCEPGLDDQFSGRAQGLRRLRMTVRALAANHGPCGGEFVAVCEAERKRETRASRSGGQGARNCKGCRDTGWMKFNSAACRASRGAPL